MVPNKTAAAPATAANQPVPLATPHGGGSPADFRATRPDSDVARKRSWTGPVAAVILAAIAGGGYFAFRSTSAPSPAAPDLTATSGSAAAPVTPGSQPNSAATAAQPAQSAIAPVAGIDGAAAAAPKPAVPAPGDSSAPSADLKPKAAPDDAAIAKAKRDAEERAKAKLDAQEKLAAQAKAKAEADERAKRRAQTELEERAATLPTRAEADERARKALQEEEERLAVARARQEAADRQAKAAAAKAAAPPPAPKRIEDLSSQAMAAYRRGELLAARNLWTEIVTHGQATSSDKALAYNNMAISYCQNGDEANCERMYIAALRADRNYQVGAGEREGAHFKRSYDRAARAVRGQ